MVWNTRTWYQRVALFPDKSRATNSGIFWCFLMKWWAVEVWSVVELTSTFNLTRSWQGLGKVALSCLTGQKEVKWGLSPRAPRSGIWGLNLQGREKIPQIRGENGLNCLAHWTWLEVRSMQAVWGTTEGQYGGYLAHWAQKELRSKLGCVGTAKAPMQLYGLFYYWFICIVSLWLCLLGLTRNNQEQWIGQLIPSEWTSSQ